MAKQSEKDEGVREAGTDVAGKDASGRQASARVRRDWVWAGILLLVVIVAYSPVGWAGYIWDDDDVVTANPVIVGPLGLKEIWTTSAADICPLTLTTFWAEHKLWGVAPLPYHLVNILLHAACAIALWRVLLCLRVPGAWLGAALWALHPVQVESVAWVTEMKNTESALFFLLALLFFAKDLKMPSLHGRSAWNWNYGLTLLFAALAMASKSSTVILPVVLCLCAWWIEGRWQWRNVAKVGPILLMSVVAGIVSIWTQKVRGADDPVWVQTWPERLVNAGHAVWFYLAKLLWPHPLMTVYPRWEAHADNALSYLPLLAVIAVGLVLWLRRESWLRPWFFAFSFFLMALLPVLGLVNTTFSRYSFVADHFQYLASMGPLALAGAGMTWLGNLSAPDRRWLQSAVKAGLLLLLGTLTWQRGWIYQDEETHWTDALAKNENCWVGYYDLGNALVVKGRMDEAIAHYEKALEINPRFPQAHSNLGLLLFQEGQINDAIVHFEKALDINPNFAVARNNLGQALSHKGQFKEAIVQLQKSLEIDPTYVDALLNLGVALAQDGRLNEAIAQFQRALEISPNNAKACNDLGLALSQTGQTDAAILDYRKALGIDPDDLAAHLNLGRALLQKKQTDEAIAQFEEVLRLNPGNADAQNTLAKLQSSGQKSPANK